MGRAGRVMLSDQTTPNGTTHRRLIPALTSAKRYLLKPFHPALVAGLGIKELPKLYPILDAPWSHWFQFLLRETTR